MKNLKLYNGCLIIVDMVNGFVTEGVLHDNKISGIVPRIVELIEQTKKEGKLIVVIKDTHTKESVELERFGNVPPEYSRGYFMSDENTSASPFRL